MKSMTATDVLLRLLDEAYSKKAWHGTNLRGALRGLAAAQTAWRPAPGRHNIWELTLHCAYWKYAVRRRLTGEKRGSFPMKGSNWFKASGGSDNEWRDVVRLLDEQHRELRDIVAEMPERELGARGASQYTNAELISGVASHDLYHTGQIQILKRLYKS